MLRFSLLNPSDDIIEYRAILKTQLVIASQEIEQSPEALRVRECTDYELDFTQGKMGMPSDDRFIEANRLAMREASENLLMKEEAVLAPILFKLSTVEDRVVHDADEAKRLRSVMGVLKMISSTTKPRFPNKSDFGSWDPKLESEWKDKWQRAPHEGYRMYMLSVQTVLYSHQGHQPIASHKLTTNDGWVITPEEIQVSLDRYRQKMDESPDLIFRIYQALYPNLTDREVSDTIDKYWLSWLEFLEMGLRSEGIVVT